MSGSPPMSTYHRSVQSDASFPTPHAAQNPQKPQNLNQKSYTPYSQASMISSPPPTTPPRTPQRSTSASGTSYSAMGAESGPKSKSKAKSRSVNIKAPAATRSDRNSQNINTIPHDEMATTKPMSTPSSMAYAGSTFHVSPAPSALPIPRHFSKSVPDWTEAKKSRIQNEISISSGKTSPITTTPMMLASETKQRESPLEIFFTADRDEKARARSSSSYQGLENGPFPPPQHSPYNFNNSATASDFSKGSRNGTGPAESPNAMFAMEMDGNRPGRPYGPAFSAPYHERINAALATSNRAPSSKQETQFAQEAQRSTTDKSEALKAYLFTGQLKNSINSSSEPALVANELQSTSIATAAMSRTAGVSAAAPRAIRSGRTQKGSPSASKSSASQYSSHTSQSRSRDSGLLNPVTPTKTPSQILDRNDTIFSDISTPSRPSKLAPSSSSFPSGEDLDDRDQTSPARNINAEPLSSVKSSDLKGMENKLRQLLSMPHDARDAAISKSTAARGGRQPDGSESMH